MHHMPGTGPGTDDAEKNKKRIPALRGLQQIKKIQIYMQLHVRTSYRCQDQGIQVKNERRLFKGRA